MSRVVWGLGWVGVAIWSLVCAAAYGLFDLVGRVSMRNADAFSSDPNTVEGIWRLLSALHSLSTWAILIGWAIVSLLILSVPWLIDRMMSSPNVRVVRGTASVRPRESRDGVIDIGPDQYTVGPVSEAERERPGPARPAPRIASRP